jgi:hypothetical protein
MTAHRRSSSQPHAQLTTTATATYADAVGAEEKHIARRMLGANQTIAARVGFNPARYIGSEGGPYGQHHWQVRLLLKRYFG